MFYNLVYSHSTTFILTPRLSQKLFLTPNYSRSLDKYLLYPATRREGTTVPPSNWILSTRKTKLCFCLYIGIQQPRKHVSTNPFNFASNILPQVATVRSATIFLSIRHIFVPFCRYKQMFYCKTVDIYILDINRTNTNTETQLLEKL